MSNENLIILSLLVPLIGAILSLLFWGKIYLQKIIYLFSTSLLFISGCLLLHKNRIEGIQVIQIGNYVAPFGITLVCDLFSSIMLILTGLTAFLIFMYSLQGLDKRRAAFGYYPLSLFLLFSLSGTFLTGDIFNMYVWLEVMMISSFVLMGLGSTKAQLEGSIKYVVINFIASGLFICGIAMLYSLCGSLNLAQIATSIQSAENSGLVGTASIFFLASLGIKAGVFPLFFWLPASYHTPPIAISALIAGLLTKVAVYILIRLFTLIFVNDISFSHNLIIYISALTMLTGVLGALIQTDLRKLLSFHIISQIGYMTLGLGLFSSAALMGSIFHIIHNVIVKTNLFLISGLIFRIQDSFKLNSLGGLYRRFPIFSAFFIISGLSLAGLPPLSGFWGKYILGVSAISKGHYLAIVIAFLVSLLTLMSMIKIWTKAFWEEKEMRNEPNYLTDWHFFKAKWAMILPVFLFIGITVCLAVYADPFLKITLEASEQLLNRQQYIDKILKP